MWKLSADMFFTAKGDMRSSPATTRWIDELVMVSPIEGKRRGLRVGGRGVREPIKGLQRIRLLEPASSEDQQISPPEDETGENPGGTKGKERRYHEAS